MLCGILKPKTHKPNNKNIMNCFEFDFDTTPGEDEVLSYFNR